MESDDEKILKFQRARRSYAEMISEATGVLSPDAWEALEMLCAPGPEAAAMLDEAVLAELHAHGLAGCVSDTDERVVATNAGRAIRGLGLEVMKASLLRQ